MSYEKLTLNGFLKEMKEVSSGSHQRRFCFVLGAGASKSSGIKSGQELVDIWESDLLERNREAHLRWKKQLGINDTNKYEFYSQYYEKRFKNTADGYNYLEKLMESAKPSIGHVMLSYILTHTEHNIVITTNFDHLIEDAVNYYEHTIPLVIGHESLAHYITGQINRPVVIKIHRDLLLDPKNRASELDALHDNWKKALDIVFSEYYPIFIGYAGNDRSVMDYLIHNSNIFSDEKGVFPYWMLYKTDKMSDMVSEFLDKSNGYLIEHNGFDEVLCQVGVTFDYQVPNDAEKCYSMLTDTIDTFTEILSGNREINQEENETVEDELCEEPKVEQAIQHITSPIELKNLFGEAMTLLDKEKYQEAAEIFRTLTEKDPQNADYYYYWLGGTLGNMGCYEEALKEAKKAVELEPENATYHHCLGAIFGKLERYEEAVKEKQMAVKLEPRNGAYHNSLGITLDEMGCHEEAEKERQRVEELKLENPEYHNGRGITLHKIGDYEEALLEERKALELNPENAKYHNNLGVTLHTIGHYEEALKEKQRAVELEPKNAEYHDSLGITLHAMGHYEEALHEEASAMRLDFGNAEYRRSFAITLEKVDHDQFLEICQNIRKSRQ